MRMNLPEIRTGSLNNLSIPEFAEKGRLDPKPWFRGAAGVQGLAFTVGRLQSLPAASCASDASECLPVLVPELLSGGMVAERNGAPGQIDSHAPSCQP